MSRDNIILERLSKGTLIVDPYSGSIFSVDKYSSYSELVGRPNHNDYLKVEIGLNGRSYRVFKHRVVWVSVHGPVPAGFVVDHVNGDKRNNSIDNLRLLTPSGNNRDHAREGQQMVLF